jgi:hypothetical protein
MTRMSAVLTRTLLVLLGSAVAVGCRSIPIVMEKSEPEGPSIVRLAGISPKRLIFLPPAEAACPNKCSDVVLKDNFTESLALVEQALQERGYTLISGSIVSRIEEKLKGEVLREQWDRTEKALLLGHATGADAIFQIQAIYVDIYAWDYLRESHASSFQRRPRKSVLNALEEWQPPAGGWILIPVLGWAYYAAANDPPSRFQIPFWKATVRARLLDLDGKIIWSGTQTVTTTDIIPDDWHARLDGKHPESKVRRSPTGKKDENFDYFDYFYNLQLQQEQLHMIIDNLIKQLPEPGSANAPQP